MTEKQIACICYLLLIVIKKKKRDATFVYVTLCLSALASHNFEPPPKHA